MMNSNKSVFYWGSPIGVLAYKLSVVMFLYTICRILFYAFNSDLFPGLNFGLFTMMMLGGLRFDISAILYINLLYIVFQLVPFKFRHLPKYQKPLDSLFYGSNAIGLALNCIDFIYYRFTQRRTTVIVFDEFRDEVNYVQLAKHFFLDYYYILFIWIILIVILIGLSKKIRVVAPRLSGIKYYFFQALAMALLSGLIIIGLRSGLPPKQDFPLVPSDAGQYTDHPNDVAIVQNTPFCMIRTLRKPIFKKQNYFSDEELNSIYSPIHNPDLTKEIKKLNVVVLIVESLSNESMGFYNQYSGNGNDLGYTPFLDSLARHSLVFLHSFANSRISIEASPSVIASIPSLQTSFTQSFYSNNSINSLATCLRSKGYATLYAHGAPNGSLGLNAFAMQAGILKYVGMNEYGNDTDYDGVWGIWDHLFLPFFVKECSKLQQPFLATVFTVSSHHPYKLPAKLANQFAEGPIPLFKTLRYADYSLRKFFEQASRQQWFRNTIFVITGDHIGKSFRDEFKTSIGAFSVPLLFYSPGQQFPTGIDDRVAQQIDVMPTILNYLGYDRPYFAFGKDLFDDRQDKIAISFVGNAFQLIWDDWVIQYNTLRTVGLYNRVRDPLLKNNLVGKDVPIQSRMERKVKAVIQQYNNRMINNRLSPD